MCFLHVDVGGLKTALVDVVKGEGLGRVGAVFVHLDRSSSSLRLLSSGCHDFRKSESHSDALPHTCADGMGLHPSWGQMAQDNLGKVSGRIHLYSVVRPPHGPAAGIARTHDAPHQHTQCIQDTWRNEIKEMQRATAAYYQNPQSDTCITAACLSLRCVSTEIQHKAMVTILSRFLCLTIEFPALSRRQEKKIWRNRDNCLGGKGHKSNVRETRGEMFFSAEITRREREESFSILCQTQDFSNHLEAQNILPGTWDEKVSCVSIHKKMNRDEEKLWEKNEYKISHILCKLGKRMKSFTFSAKTT